MDCPICHPAEARARLAAGGLIACLAALWAGLAGAAVPVDPLQSVQWASYYERHFSEGPVVFDERVRVLAPATAEDSMRVPVTVDARALDHVEEILVIADYNPIPVVLRFYPRRARPYIAFQVKLQQASPLRAAVRTTDGTWHLGGTWIDAAGGGCTLPSLASGSLDWAARLGEVYGRLWPPNDGGQRLRLRLMHPMDTGLADGIPAFYIDDLRLLDGAGGLHLQLLPFEPLSENPVFGFELGAGVDSAVELQARDNNGNRIRARLERP